MAPVVVGASQPASQPASGRIIHEQLCTAAQEIQGYWDEEEVEASKSALHDRPPRRDEKGERRVRQEGGRDRELGKHNFNT